MTKTLRAGEILIDEGSSSQEMYELLDGELSVSKQGRHVGDISKPGSFIGELSWLLDVSRRASVKARTDVEVRVIDDAENFFTENSRRSLAVARLLAQRLDAMDEQFIAMSKRLEKYEGAAAQDSDNEPEDTQAFLRLRRAWRI